MPLTALVALAALVALVAVLSKLHPRPVRPFDLRDKSIVIVGSAPTVRDLGDIIDSYDVVVRVSALHPRDAVHWGSKTDAVHIGQMQHRKGGAYRRGNFGFADRGGLRSAVHAPGQVFAPSRKA